MAQAEVVGNSSDASLKAANNGQQQQQQVPSVSNNSTEASSGTNDDEKKGSEDQQTKDGRRVSRQQSAPTTNVRVSFKKNRKNSKKDSIGNESKNNSNDDNINTNNNNNINNNNININNNNSKNNNNMNTKPNINNNNNNNNNGKQTNSLESSDNDSEADVKSDNPLKRYKSLPANMRYDPCREFDNFAGDWVDSKGQPVIISAWGVIRYPNNPKLRFEAVHMGPNHLSVTFDRDPKKRKFVGKLNHDCDVLIWSNDTRWTRKGVKIQAAQEPSTPSTNNGKNGNSSGSNTPTIDETEPKIDPNNKLNRQGSCIVM